MGITMNMLVAELEYENHFKLTRYGQTSPHISSYKISFNS